MAAVLVVASAAALLSLGGRRRAGRCCAVSRPICAIRSSRAGRRRSACSGCGSRAASARLRIASQRLDEARSRRTSAAGHVELPRSVDGFTFTAPATERRPDVHRARAPADDDDPLRLPGAERLTARGSRHHRAASGPACLGCGARELEPRRGACGSRLPRRRGSDVFNDPAGGEADRRRTASARSRRGRLPALGPRAVHVRRRVRCGRPAPVGGRAPLGEARVRGVAHRASRWSSRSSPTGAPMTRTRSWSPNDAVFLRVSRRGPACALHARLDGEAWRFVRHFPLQAPDGLHAGFLVQSPTGDGATARFDEIDFVAERLADLRSGV